MKKSLITLIISTLFAYAVFSQEVWSPQAAGLLPSNYNVADISIVSDQVVWAVAIDYNIIGAPLPSSLPFTRNRRRVS